MDAVRRYGPARHVPQLEELWKLLQRPAAQVDVVVIGAGALEPSVLEVVRRIVRERPHAAVVAYCTPGAQQAASLRALAAAGVHQIVLEGSDDAPISLRAVLQDAQRQCAAEWLLHELSGLFEPALHPFLEAALANPTGITSVPEVASALGVHRKTLFNRCRRAGVPMPAELLVWVRLSLVAYYLDCTGCTVETIATEMAYPSASALRNTLKRYTSRTAQELRGQGAVRIVVEHLRNHAASRPARRGPIARGVTVAL
jgi:AraC-like DNA-binding protein